MKLATLLALAAATSLAGTIYAQNDNYLNRTRYYAATWAGFVQGSALATGGEALDTIGKDELVEYGINAATPASQSITGARYVVQDQNALTTHNYLVVGYGELATGGPDVNDNWMSVGPILSPLGTAAAPAAWIVTLGFTTPAQAPRGETAYVGLSLPGGTNTDILLNQFIDNDTTNAAGSSVPGQSYATAYPVGMDSHRLGMDPVTGVASWDTNAASTYFDLEVEGPGGHALIMSNESTNPTVTTNGGLATTPHTAFFPDAVNFNNSAPARADTVGYIYQDNAFVQGVDFVALMVSFNLNPLNTILVPMPISNFLPNSSGNVCSDITVNAVAALMLAPTSTGTGTPTPQYFEITLPFGASSALITPGQQFVMQGFTLDLTNNIVRGGPCGAQKF